MHRARRASETSKQPPSPQTLSPPLLNTLKLAPPIPNAQGCRRALADCTGWDGAITSGVVSSPLVSAAANAKMLVTPRAGMQSGEWWRTRPCACVGRRRPHPQRTKKRARPAPLPVSSPRAPSAARRSPAIAATISPHQHPIPDCTLSPLRAPVLSVFAPVLYLAVTLTAQS